MWSSKSARSSPTKKLVYRWKNSEGSLTRGEVVNKGEVQSIVCNDSHVFLSLKTGVVSVFGLSDAAWVRDLAPGEGKPSEISGCA